MTGIAKSSGVGRAGPYRRNLPWFVLGAVALGGLAGRSVLVLGAGEMATLIAKSLKEREITSIFVANRTYERGVEDETLACGTGAVTIAALCNRMGLVDPPVKCMTSGGDTLEVSFCIENDRAVNCTLTGPAVIVFDGYLETENFK